MLLTQAETASVQTNVIEIFTNARILPQSYYPSPLRLSANSEENTFHWSSQWKPEQNRYEAEQLKRTWNWSVCLEGKTNLGWYNGNTLLALCRLKIVSAEKDGERFKNPSVAISLFERHQIKEIGWFKGLTRPFFYETARQISMLKNIPDMHVLGSYMATDQDDFDLFFEMQSDVPDYLPLKDCNFRTRKSSKPFEWSSLPIYLKMMAEKKRESAPTPAI